MSGGNEVVYFVFSYSDLTLGGGEGEAKSALIGVSLGTRLKVC